MPSRGATSSIRNVCPCSFQTGVQPFDDVQLCRERLGGIQNGCHYCPGCVLGITAVRNNDAVSSGRPETVFVYCSDQITDMQRGNMTCWLWRCGSSHTLAHHYCENMLFCNIMENKDLMNVVSVLEGTHH